MNGTRQKAISGARAQAPVEIFPGLISEGTRSMGSSLRHFARFRLGTEICAWDLEKTVMDMMGRYLTHIEKYGHTAKAVWDPDRLTMEYSLGGKGGAFKASLGFDVCYYSSAPYGELYLDVQRNDRALDPIRSNLADLAMGIRDLCSFSASKRP